MALNFAAGLRACIVGVALMLATAQAEDQKQPTLMGATREQVLERYGQPRRGMVAGNREVMFFARERLVLRDGVVVEIEPLASEPAPRPPPPPATTSASTASEPTTAAAPGETDPVGPRPASAPGVAAENADTANAPALDPSPAVAPESQLEISFVRTPPASGGLRTDLTPRPAPALPAPAGPAPRVESVAAASPVATPVSTPLANPARATRHEVAPVASNPVAAPTPSPPDVAPRAARSEAAASRARAVAALVPEEDETEPLDNNIDASAEEAASSPPVEKGKADADRRRLSEADFPAPSESIFTMRTYLISLLVIVGGIGYLVWQRHQRRLDLEASTVSRTPFIVPASQGAATRFTTELLAKLEWRRFEELVASYYGKTGVVAVRTKTGPLSPVQIRISWKGEPRPFACVRCIAHPQGLIDPQPIQELNEVLTKEDIRRGYVVTTGKFNVPARDVAEEKHVTLLPGDILVEKLNALPDAARAELMQEITTGDYTTPSCPKCEAPAVHPEGEPTVWRCPHHPDEVIPVRH